MLSLPNENQRLKLPLAIQIEPEYTAQSIYVLVDADGFDVGYANDLSQAQEIIQRCNAPLRLLCLNANCESMN